MISFPGPEKAIKGKNEMISSGRVGAGLGEMISFDKVTG